MVSAQQSQQVARITTADLEPDGPDAQGSALNQDARARRSARRHDRTSASERLHAAIVERRLSHLDDPALNAHVRQAIARDTPRGWRIDKLKSRENIDAVVALAMAVEAAEAPTPTVELLGWL